MAMPDLKKTINKILSKLVYYDRQREVLTGSTSSYSSATGSFTSGTLMTLKANTRYLLLGYGNSDSGNAFQYYSSFAVTAGAGTYKKLVSLPNQPYASSGGSHPFMGYIETGNSTVGIGISSYKYTTGLTYHWYVNAIEL